MQRREFIRTLLATGSILRLSAQTANVTFERPLPGTPHKGKVLAAIQPHSDDVPILCGGTVAKLLKEGYTGYLIRATNDDMGDDIGERGTIGENVLRNERETDELTRVMGLQRKFDLNYSNHRMSGISQTELQLRLIFLIRLLKVDTVFCYDPWAHDEENPDHYVLGHCVEAACWMAGRAQPPPYHTRRRRRQRRARLHQGTHAQPRPASWAANTESNSPSSSTISALRFRESTITSRKTPFH